MSPSLLRAISIGLAAAVAPAAAAPASAVGTAFTYQGSLEDSGVPAGGSCDFQFTVFPASASGSPLGSSTTLAVPVSVGVFSVEIDVGATAFDGSDRWLQIAVRCPTGAGSYTTLSPRQRLTATPYALHANRAGSVDWANIADLPAGFLDGVDNDTQYSAGSGLSLSGTQFSVDPAAVQSRVSGVCSAGSSIRVINANGTVTCETDDDSAYTAGSGLTLAHGEFSVNPSQVQSRVSGSCPAGNSIRTINQDGSVTCETDDVGAGDITAVIAGANLTGGGTAGDVTLALTTPLVVTKSASDPMVSITNTGTGIAVRGINNVTGAGIRYGGYFESHSDSGRAVAGAAAGTSSSGIFGSSNGASGFGVYGLGNSPTAFGGFFTSNGNDFDLGLGGSLGTIRSDPSIASSDIVIAANDDIVLQLDANGGDSSEVTVVNSDTGIVARIDEAGTVSAVRIDAANNATGIANATIEATNANASGYTASFTSTSSSATAHVSNFGSGPVIHLYNGNGTLGADVADFINAYSISGFFPSFTTDVEFRVTANGEVRADGAFVSGGADFAESLPGTSGLEPGDVLAIGPTGVLERSSAAFQKAVAGVYSTKPGILGGEPVDGPIPGNVPLAITGVVPVKVSAENGAIVPGDLLVASSTPGMAMAGGDTPASGTILGKALEAWDGGTGTIKILLVLQ